MRAWLPIVFYCAACFQPEMVVGQEAPAKSGLSAEEAVRRGLAVVQRAAGNYPQHRTCFSCHHQTLPLLAMDAARKAKFPIDEPQFRLQVEFTHNAFARRHEDLNAGDGIGGKTLTVGYALWALDLARHERDETTTAMVAYLLKTQTADGHWPRHSLRPPLEESLVAATVLAADFAGKYATDPQRESVAAAVGRAKQWLDEVKLVTQEDYAFRLWGLKLLESGNEKQNALRDAILARQRPDGGWSQADGLASDAYAAGQTLFVLHEAGMAASEPAYQRGVRFLLETQHADGSWLVETRAEPVQVFFDNGDPHGKHQFISIAATAWAVTALANDVRGPATDPPPNISSP